MSYRNIFYVLCLWFGVILIITTGLKGIIKKEIRISLNPMDAPTIHGTMAVILGFITLLSGLGLMLVVIAITPLLLRH